MMSRSSNNSGSVLPIVQRSGELFDGLPTFEKFCLLLLEDREWRVILQRLTA